MLSTAECGRSDPAVLVCTGVWGLLSFIALILYLRWHVDQSSARDEPIAKLPHAEAPALAEQGTLPAVGPLRSLTDGAGRFLPSCCMMLHDAACVRHAWPMRTIICPEEARCLRPN